MFGSAGSCKTSIPARPPPDFGLDEDAGYPLCFPGMRSPRIKVCGITTGEDALVAVRAGADALGFVFAESSPRRVTLAQAQQIIRSLPPFVAKVGVFVDARESWICQCIEECGLDTVQLHGSETPDFCRLFSVKVIKGFRLKSPEVVETMAKYPVDAWLIDAYVAGQAGGTGQVCNWDWARQATQYGVPVVLAGGLTPQNVREAIQQVSPFAVDVSSGIEYAPGRKDHGKIQEFVKAVQAIPMDSLGDKQE